MAVNTRNVAHLTHRQRDIVDYLYTTDETIHGYRTHKGELLLYYRDLSIGTRTVQSLVRKGYLDELEIEEEPGSAYQSRLRYTLSEEGRGRYFLHKLRTGK